MFPSFDVFCQVMDQTTSDFECLVVHNNSKSNKLEDQVFWYKASKHEPFKLGAQAYWDLCEDSDSESADGDPEEEKMMRASNRGPVVSVIKS
jgi:hypothetical protein